MGVIGGYASLLGQLMQHGVQVWARFGRQATDPAGPSQATGRTELIASFRMPVQDARSGSYNVIL
jgi:hypothetical protein